MRVFQSCVSFPAFLLLGTLLDTAVWYYVKDLQIYDDADESDSKKRKTRD